MQYVFLASRETTGNQGELSALVKKKNRQSRRAVAGEWTFPLVFSKHLHLNVRLTEVVTPGNTERSDPFVTHTPGIISPTCYGMAARKPPTEALGSRQ